MKKMILKDRVGFDCQVWVEGETRCGLDCPQRYVKTGDPLMMWCRSYDSRLGLIMRREGYHYQRCEGCREAEKAGRNG